MPLEPQFPDLARTLIALRDADLELRERLLREGRLNEGYDEEMRAQHDENAAVLAKVLEEYGFPTVTMVGEAGAAAAWLVVQHAIAQPTLMRRYRTLMEGAVARDEARAVQLAYLSDRINTFEGKAQRYGTQFDWDTDGRMSPLPYDDERRVNERRAALGLNTLAEQTAQMRLAAAETTPPADLGARQRAYERWRRQVGWMD